MSVESPKRSWRTSQARSTRAPISSWSVRAPSSSASSKPISGGTPQIYERGRTPSPRLVPAEVLHDLGVALRARAEGDQLEAPVAGLEGAGDGGCDPDRVELAHLLDVVPELYAAGAPDHHIDLLGLLVAVGEGVPLPGLHLLERDAALLCVQVLVR